MMSKMGPAFLVFGLAFFTCAYSKPQGLPGGGPPNATSVEGGPTPAAVPVEGNPSASTPGPVDQGGSSPLPGGSSPGPEGSSPGPEGSTPGSEGSTPGPDGSSPGPEGSTPGTEGSSPGPVGSTPGQEGSSPGPEGSTPGPEGSSSLPEGSSPGPEGSSPLPGPSSPLPEASSPGPEGSSPGPIEGSTQADAVSPGPNDQGNNASSPEPAGGSTGATPEEPLGGGNGTTPASLGGENNNGNQSEAVSGHETKEGELPSADKVKFFIVGFRHGNRNPAQFLKNDTTHNTWAWEGASQLTSIGRRQASSLGQFLRKRYSHIVPEEFFPSKVKAYSSSAERCQQTLQSVMLGFYPPVWKKALLWQPVPYDISDPLLRMYNVKCPEYTSAYQPISDDSGKGADAWLQKEDPELLKYISENSGLNASLSDLADVADNIGNMRLFNVPFPDWVSNPSLKNYTGKSMYAAITSFAEAHQVLCANDSACARMMAGLWLDQVIQTLNQAKNASLKDRVANFYAAHTETVLSLIRLLKAKDVAETPTSAGFILEFTDTPAPSVRFIFHEPDPNNPDIRKAEVKPFEFSEEEWVPVDKFVEAVKTPAFNDWQGACSLPKCPV